MIDALVQQQNQNLLRLQQAIKNLSELLSKRSVQLRSQKRYAAKPTLSPRRVNARMHRTPLCQRSRYRLINPRFRSLSLSESNAGLSGAPLRQRPCFRFFPIMCAMTSVFEIWSPLPTVQGTLQRSSCGETGALS